MNKIILIGRLAFDPEGRYTTSENFVAKFRLAVEPNYKKSNDTPPNYFDVELWGKAGENLCKHIRQGDEVCIEGELKQGKPWVDKNGSKRQDVFINASSNVKYLRKSQKNQGQGQSRPPAPQQQSTGTYGGDYGRSVNDYDDQF